MDEKVTQALSLLTPSLDFRLSRLDELKYAIASAGYSAERIEAAEQDVINGANALGCSVERFAGEALKIFYAYQTFSTSMAQLVIYAGEALPALEAIAEGISTLAADTEALPRQPVKPTEKTPYYQKNKQTWWK